MNRVTEQIAEVCDLSVWIVIDAVVLQLCDEADFLELKVVVFHGLQHTPVRRRQWVVDF